MIKYSIDDHCFEYVSDCVGGDAVYGVEQHLSRLQIKSMSCLRNASKLLMHQESY